MKRANRLLILLGVCVVVFGAFFAVSRMEKHMEAIRTSGQTVLSIDGDTVDSLSWESENGAFSFRREENWVYESDEAFPVSTDAMNARIEPFRNLIAAFVIDQPEKLSDYGLEEPQCTITLTAGDETYTIRMGTTSAIDQHRYFSLGDGKVYLAQEDFRELFDATLPDLIQNDVVPEMDTVTGIRISGDHDLTADSSTEGKSLREEDVLFAENGTVPLDPDLVESFVDDIRYLALDSYVSYSADLQALKDTGLDSPAATAEILYTTDETEGSFTIHVGKVRQEEPEEGEDAYAYYARVGDSPILYEIASTYGTRLTSANLDTLRHQEAFPADTADIAALEITLDGEHYTLTSIGEDGTQELDDDGNPVFRFLGNETDIASVKSALSGLTATSFTTDQSDGKEELSITVTLTSGPRVCLTLYRYDGDSCLAVVDGTPLALVSRQNAMKLTEAIYAIVL